MEDLEDFTCSQNIVNWYQGMLLQVKAYFYPWSVLQGWYSDPPPPGLFAPLVEYHSSHLCALLRLRLASHSLEKMRTAIIFPFEICGKMFFRKRYLEVMWTFCCSHLHPGFFLPCTSVCVMIALSQVDQFQEFRRRTAYADNITSSLLSVFLKGFTEESLGLPYSICLCSNTCRICTDAL